MSQKSSLRKSINRNGCPQCVDNVELINQNEVQLGMVLGEGAYGVVKEGTYKGENVAVKISTQRAKWLQPDFIREVSTLAALKGHPDIVEFVGVVNNGPNNQPSIAIELASMSLSTRIKSPLHRSEKCAIMYQIVRGMVYMKKVGIWHRDLKPQNILLMGGSGKLKITDFGLSRGGPFQWIDHTDIVYTLWYRAPEILERSLRGPNISAQYDEKAEVFSMGCTFWDVLANTNKDAFYYLKANDESTQLRKFLQPFLKSTGAWGRTHEELMKKLTYKLKDVTIKNTPQLTDQERTELLYRVLDDHTLVDEVDLLMKLCAFESDDRITMEEALQHPYFDEVRDDIDTHFPVTQFSCTPDEPPTVEELVAKKNDVQKPKLMIEEVKYVMLVSWMEEFCEEMTPTSAFLAIHLATCILQKRRIENNWIQKNASALLLIASKYFDKTPYSERNFLFLGDSEAEINERKQLERDVLLEVGAMLNYKTAWALLLEKIHENHGKDIELLQSLMRYRKAMTGILMALIITEVYSSDQWRAEMVYRLFVKKPLAEAEVEFWKSLIENKRLERYASKSAYMAIIPYLKDRFSD